MTNNLFGGQIGTLLNFAVTPQFGLFALPKGGVFGNQINITNTFTSARTIHAFNHHASQTVCSLLGELDTGCLLVGLPERAVFRRLASDRRVRTWLWPTTSSCTTLATPRAFKPSSRTAR